MIERFDCIVVWGHGIEYLPEILKMVQSIESLDIVHFEKYKAHSIKKLVHSIYSFDYAPLIHLKAKIKYLEKVPSIVYFIFIKNSDPQHDFFGEGKFRHVESLVIRNLKQKIRNRFNPRDKYGNLTHDHIVHATDNESQTDSILKLIGYKDGVNKFKNGHKIIRSPHYIKEPSYFNIQLVDFRNLFCRNAVIKNGKCILKTLPVSESVQYLSLYNKKLYHDYISNFSGTILKQIYSLDRYYSMAKDFKYLVGPNNSDLIIATPLRERQFVIIDGLHRAALHLYSGHQNIRVCIYE